MLLPLDALKIKRQVNPEAFRGRGFVRIFMEEGTTLYRGWGWTMARNAPGSFAVSVLYSHYRIRVPFQMMLLYALVQSATTVRAFFLICFFLTYVMSTSIRANNVTGSFLVHQQLQKNTHSASQTFTKRHGPKISSPR